MKQFGSYLVCKEYIEDVGKFLRMFLEEESGKYNHPGWITFRHPDTNFIVNLMPGGDQDLTQNMTFEIYCDSMTELNGFAKKHKCKIISFLATKAPQKYNYHYIEIFGPENICKVEISYSEDVE